MERVGRWVCLALLCGCRREESSEPPLLESQGPPETSSSVPELSHSDFTCFADVEYDLGQDGTIEGWGFEGYDAEHPSWLMYAVRDENANGLPDAIETYERDAQGNVILFVRQGRSAETRISAWDEQGNLLREEVDYESDGLLDWIITYTWFAPGLMSSQEMDSAGDGILDLVLSWEYDPRGLLLSHTMDYEPDGVADLIFAYTYDELGRTLTSHIDYENDGVAERRETYTWLDALHADTEMDTDDDGVPDGRSEVELDEQNHVVARFSDYNLDGTWEWEYTASYDDEGRLLTSDEDDRTDYEYELHLAYTYDELGRIVQHSEYENWDGTIIDLRTTTTFQGSCP